MKKTAYNHISDIERKMREIRTLHAMEKLSTRDAKLILQDLEASFNTLLGQLSPEQRGSVLRNRRTIANQVKNPDIIS